MDERELVECEGCHDRLPKDDTLKNWPGGKTFCLYCGFVDIQTDMNALIGDVRVHRLSRMLTDVMGVKV